VGDKYNMILVNTFDQNENSKAKVEKENLNNMTSSKEEEDEIANAGMSNDNGTEASNLDVPRDLPINSIWILSNDIFSLNSLSAGMQGSNKQLAMIFPDDKHINTNQNLIRNDNNNISSTRLPVIVMAHLERLVQPFNSQHKMA
jgi:hypothetical protein